MAEQEQPVADEGTDAVEEPKKKKKGSSLLLLLIPALLLPAAGASYLVYSRYEQVAEAAAAVGRIFNSTPAQAEERSEPIEYGVFQEMKMLTVNPAGDSGRFLQVSLGLEAPDEGTFEEFTTREVVVRDTVLKILSSYSVEQLGTLDARNQLRDDLRAAINGVLEDGEIQRLYFTQYVLQ